MAESPAEIQWVDKPQGLWRDKWGALMKLGDEVVSVIQPPARLETDADFDAYTPPDPAKASVLRRAGELLARFGGRRAVAVVGEASFAPAQNLRAGLQNLSLDFYDRPERVRKVMASAVEYHVELYRRLVGMGVEIVVLGDDFGSKTGPMISPAQFEEFLLPGVATVVREVHGAGGRVILHSDGDIWKLLPMIVGAGVDMLGPLEGPYMDLAKVRDEFDVGVMGNVDVDLLSRGTVEEVRRATAELVRRLAPGGRHILASGNSIASSVRGENFMAMLVTAQTYGQ